MSTGFCFLAGFLFGDTLSAFLAGFFGVMVVIRVTRSRGGGGVRS